MPMNTDAWRRWKTDNAWRKLAGHPEKAPVKPTRMPSLSSLEKTEWSKSFETLMRIRLVMGAFRYGLLNAPGKPKWDRIASCERRLAGYRRTGDLGLLVDVANLCLLEFEEGEHPDRHIAEGDGEEHCDEV